MATLLSRLGRRDMAGVSDEQLDDSILAAEDVRRRLADADAASAEKARRKTEADALAAQRQADALSAQQAKLDAQAKQLCAAYAKQALELIAITVKLRDCGLQQEAVHRELDAIVTATGYAPASYKYPVMMEAPSFVVLASPWRSTRVTGHHLAHWTDAIVDDARKQYGAFK